jgi:hypothetical protein
LKRFLRIAAFACSLVAFLSFAALWASSYLWKVNVQARSVRLLSVEASRGRLIIFRMQFEYDGDRQRTGVFGRSLDVTATPVAGQPPVPLPVSRLLDSKTVLGFKVVGLRSQLTLVRIPFWFPTITSLLLAIGAKAKPRWRFNLTEALAVVTFAAGVAGLAAWVARWGS